MDTGGNMYKGNVYNFVENLSIYLRSTNRKRVNIESSGKPNTFNIWTTTPHGVYTRVVHDSEDFESHVLKFISDMEEYGYLKIGG